MARLDSFPDHFTLDRYAHEMRRRELDRLWRRAALALHWPGASIVRRHLAARVPPHPAPAVIGPGCRRPSGTRAEAIRPLRMRSDAATRNR